MVAINAASMSTKLSGLPFSGPIGATRMAHVDGTWVAFPTHSEWSGPLSTWRSPAGVLDDGDVAIMMVEAEATVNTLKLVAEGAPKPTEEVVAGGLEAAKPAIRELCRAQSALADVAAKPVAEFPVFLEYEADAFAAVEKAVKDEVAEALKIAGKAEREEALDLIKAKAHDLLDGDFEGREKEISAAFRSVTKKEVRARVLRDQVRIDGRGPRDIRPLTAEVGLLPRVHGSALFERGETQILGVTTLNMLRMEQNLDTLSPEKHKRYMHNYNFPPYSTGETGRVGSPKRREIGHGALAERALIPVLPAREEFPYAIRQVSEALSSNGSTSMGSVCASTMSLLAAGVPLKAPVAGIAMGLISDEVDGKTTISLTDILGAEDAFGDMDFKVASNRDFVTALQLDTKLDGIPSDVLAGALQQAHAPGDPRRDGRRSSRRGHVGLRAAGHLGEDPGRQDRHGDRAEGSDHQRDPGRDRATARSRRDHGPSAQADRPDQRDRQPDDAEGRRQVPRHRREDGRVRRVRLAAAGRDGAAHLQGGRRQAGRPGRGPPERGRQGRGRDRRDRRVVHGRQFSRDVGPAPEAAEAAAAGDHPPAGRGGDAVARTR